MLAIVFDMEMTVKRRRKETCSTIEIGAVKVMVVEGKAEITDTFQTCVKPTVNPKLSEETKQFTGISQEEVDNAPTFREAIEAFRQWIGEGEYYLCAWGDGDKLQLLDECRALQLEYDWIRNYNDLQLQFSAIMKVEKHQHVGLQRAMELVELPFSGLHHRALDDAKNTASLFVKLADQYQLEKNEAEDGLSYTTEVVYMSERFSNNPFDKLKDMFS